MLALFRECLSLLSPRDRWRWIRVLPLLLLTSAIETVSAASVFVLVSVIAAPESVQTIPWIGPTLHDLIGGAPAKAGLTVVAAVAAIYLVKSALLAATEYYQAVAAAESASDLTIRLLTGYVRAPYAFHLARNSAGAIDTTVRLAGTIFGNVVSAFVHIAAETAVMLGIVCVLIAASPSTTLAVALVLLIVGSGLLRAMRSASSDVGRRVHQLSAERMKLQIQVLSAIDEIQVLGRGARFIERFADLCTRLARANALMNLLGALPRIVVETLFICGALVATTSLLASGLSNVETVSLLGLFAYAGFRIIPSVNRILMHVHTIRSDGHALRTIATDLAEVGSVSAAEAADSDWSFADSIELRHVSLCYDPRQAPVLRDVSLSIRRGERVALVGLTGSGKSSVMRLLTGLLAPSEGQIAVDGEPLHQRIAAWRRQIGYVPQHVHLVDDTVLSNVAFGVPTEEIDRDRAERAARAAQIDQTIRGLPEQWQTEIGDGGVRLSGGERQRVGIARALYHEPTVLLLDEATSSLDARTESALLRQLESAEPPPTLIVVTHRLATVRGFDRIFYFSGGGIAASGSFDEVATASPEFRGIVESASRE